MSKSIPIPVRHRSIAIQHPASYLFYMAETALRDDPLVALAEMALKLINSMGKELAIMLSLFPFSKLSRPSCAYTSFINYSLTSALHAFLVF